MGNTLISNHIFLHPFAFKSEEQDLEALLVSKGFILEAFAYNSDETAYNQHSYFYDFAEEVMFNFAKKGETSSTTFFKRYAYTELGQEASYEISVKSGQKFSLSIKQIRVHYLRQFKVGVLVFHLENTQYAALEDILLINDYGRRTYPQFLPLQSAKGSFLADQIRLHMSENTEVVENFERVQGNLSQVLPAHITHFLGNDIEPVIDDRMFVCCGIYQDEIANEISAAYLHSEDSSVWYKLLNIDTTDATCQDSAMRKEINQRGTYRRWLDCNTLFGVSRYSFIMLKTTAAEYLNSHLVNFYAEMATLCLLQRASLLTFANEAARLSEHLNTREVGSLYADYIRFRNKVYFREITAQEQGIELYDLLRKQMRLDEELKELDEDIAELNAFVNTRDQSRLANVASYFLPATLVAATLAFVSDKNIFQIDSLSFHDTPNPWVVILMLIVGFAVWKNKWIIDKLEKIFNR